MKWIPLVLLSFGLALPVAAEEGLPEVRKAADAEFQSIDASYKAELVKLKDQILITLGKARDAAKNSGNLDGVKILDAEIKRWNEEGDLPLVEPEYAGIKKMNEAYKATAADRFLKKQRSIVAWFRSYDARLEKLEKSLVAADKIKEAEEVRSERDTRRDSMTLHEAQEAVKAADPVGETAKIAGPGPAKSWFSLKGVKWKKAEGSHNFMTFLDNFDRSISVKGQRLNSRDYIFAHASGRIEYGFEKPVTGFRGAACLAKEAANIDQSDIIFSIETDEGEVYRSKLINASHQREDIEISFKPSKKLVLIVNDNGNNESDWSLWLNPQYR